MPGNWLPPASLEGPWEPGSGFSSDTLLSPCCHLLPPPVEAWCCLFWSQDISSRRHKKGTSPIWALCSQPPARKEAIAGSAPGRGILAALLSLGRPREMCPVCGLPHQGQLLRASATRARPPQSSGQQPHLSRQISPPHFRLCCVPCLISAHLSICLKLSFLKAQRDADFISQVL